MRKKVFLLYFITILLCSCANQSIVTDLGNELCSPSSFQVIEAYKKILRNEINFFSTKLQKNISLQDYCIEDCTVDDFEKYYRFTVVDMDGDGIPELVLYVGPPGTNLIFYCDDEKIYGHTFGEPETKDIKINGLFEISNRVYWALCKLEFFKDSYNYVQIAVQDSNNYAGETKFYLHGTESTENEFNDFINNNKHWEIDLAMWYDFNEKNVEKYLIWNE